MTAGALPTTQPAAKQPRPPRFARWRPGVALSAVAGALIASQLIALAVVLAAGGDDAPDWLSAIAIVLADLVLLGVVLAVARRGAEKLGPATLGIRRTAFWPAVGWMFVTYFAVMVFNGRLARARRDRQRAARARTDRPRLRGGDRARGLRDRGRGADRGGDHVPRLPVPGADALARTVDRRPPRRPRVRRRPLCRVPTAAAAADGRVRLRRVPALLV